MMKSMLIAAAALAGTFATGASGTVFDFRYTTLSGVIATGQVSATNVGAFYSVDNVTGARGDAMITGYDFYDPTPQSFNYNAGYTSNVDFSYYAGPVNYEVRYTGSGYGTEFQDGDSSLLVTSFTLSPVATASAVPEASTWALMMAGVGVLGGVMRRRRSGQVRFA